MTEPILVSTDFSTQSEAAYPFAARLAKTLGTSVRLLHVSDIDVFHGANGGHPWEKDLLRYIEERTAESAGRLRAYGVEVETLVRTGIAAPTIVEELEKGVSLGIIATRGHGAILRAILGSVSAKVVQHARVPVLTVPQEAEDMPIHRVLFPIDFTEVSTGVLDRALEFLRPLEPTIEFLHAHAPVETLGGVVNVRSSSDVPTIAALSERLAEFAARATSAGITATWHLADAQSPASAIIERGRQTRAHLIVLAGHGRRGLERLLLGSVADAVVRRSDRPVLVLKSNEPAASQGA